MPSPPLAGTVGLSLPLSPSLNFLLGSLEPAFGGDSGVRLPICGAGGGANDGAGGVEAGPEEEGPGAGFGACSSWEGLNRGGSRGGLERNGTGGGGPPVGA